MFAEVTVHFNACNVNKDIVFNDLKCVINTIFIRRYFCSWFCISGLFVGLRVFPIVCVCLIRIFVVGRFCLSVIGVENFTSVAHRIFD